MKLFDIVPDRFFSILSSAKKELYIEAILLLRETARSSDLVVRRTYLHSLLSDRLGPLLASDDFSEEENGVWRRRRCVFESFYNTPPFDGMWLDSDGIRILVIV